MSTPEKPEISRRHFQSLIVQDSACDLAADSAAASTCCIALSMLDSLARLKEGKRKQWSLSPTEQTHYYQF